MKRRTLAVVLMLVVALALGSNVAATNDNPAHKIPVIIMFKDKADKDLVKQHGGEIKKVYTLKPAMAATMPEKAVAALQKHKNIAYIVEDLEIFTMEETTNWGWDRIGAGSAHGTTMGGGITLAIMDTGVDYTHPDLNCAGGWDFADSDDDPMDHNGHGTHVAGIAAAVRGNNIGIIGTAPEVTCVPYKVFPDSGPGSYRYVIEALEYAISAHPDVISMSFGSPYSAGDPGIEPWLRDAASAGILLVAAAGNDGQDVIYPARYPSVMAVGATTSSDGRASFSCTGDEVEIAAPGIGILSTYPGDRYASMSGTSMATPFVSGTAALIWSADPSLTNVQVRQILTDTAIDLGPPGRDTSFGFGLVNAQNAVEAVPAPSPGDTMIVGSLTVTADTETRGRRSSRLYNFAEARVLVIGPDGPESDVTVYGHWNGLTSDSDIGTTRDGYVTLRSDSTRRSGTFTFTVDRLEKSGLLDGSSPVSESTSVSATYGR